MSVTAKVPLWMSTEEFLNWNAGDGYRWQLVDGEPRGMAPATRTQAALQAELAALIRNHLREQRSPCTVLTEAAIVPRKFSAHNVRIPDLAVTCSSYETEQTLLADAVLLIEILSPSNPAETWANIWAYTTIPSVREILIVQSDAIGCKLLRRRTDGEWPEEAEPIDSGDLVLNSIGFRVPLRDIYVTTRLARAQSG